MSDLISRQAAIDAIDEIESEVADGDGFQYEKWRQFFCDLPSVELQPTCNPDKISQFIDGIEEMFADIRERFIDDSVCGLCEYDGAYVGESGDWCNECPGFEKDDCFKLSDKTRKEWTEEIIKALGMVPSAELQPTCNKIATSCNQLATDYIRREDAIEVIEKMMEVYWDRKVVLARAWEQIKDLPSADIDLSDYSDRLWRNAYEQGKAVSKDALDEAYAHGYTAAEADFHKKNQWTPVTERLPENEQDVLVTVNDGCTHVEIDYFTGAHFLNYWDEVLAWMPLPEPWKGEDDAEV